jgi:hypothetical protein
LENIPDPNLEWLSLTKVMLNKEKSVTKDHILYNSIYIKL